MYIDDEKKADQFIRECFEQCHNDLAIKFFGEELILEMVSHLNVPSGEMPVLCGV